MKVNGNGRAKVITPDEQRQLFSDGLTITGDRAVWQVWTMFPTQLCGSIN
ncbi:hypothetical protein JYQ62_01565 [Nostoc sp. UHCC 0702]|nr:hypothetical protein JYQ62_01565 [Nostoc sp. UHCC 0702]